MTVAPGVHQYRTCRKLLIFGSGGFGREVAWLARRCLSTDVDLEFVVDRAEYVGAGAVSGIPVRMVQNVSPKEDTACVIAVGDPSLRRHAASLLGEIGHRPLTLIHPNAEFSDSVVFGEGTIICAGNIFTVDIKIGRQVHVNLNCTIGHDVTVGDFTTICPGVNISGNVSIGSNVFIGTGATIINGTSAHPLVIGDGATLAAGTCVTKAVDANALVAGVPATRRR